MTPKWERAPAAPDLSGEMFMDAVLRPNRSLSKHAFEIVFLSLVVVNAAVAIAFIARGAFPVAGFLGLDVLGFWLAFKLNYKSAQAEEHVRIAPAQIHVARKSAKGDVEHWVLNPAWARVDVDRVSVRVLSGGWQMRLGRFLSPAERTALARSLDDALWRAKRAPLQT